MVTDCSGTRDWDFSDTEAVFLHGSLSLLKVIIPLAIALLLWRIYITNKDVAHQRISILRLNETSTDNQGADLQFSRTSPFILLLCITTTVVTFNLGLLSFLAYEILRQLMQKLLS
jgi:uncharacterized protein with PQ loop repeat